MLLAGDLSGEPSAKSIPPVMARLLEQGSRRLKPGGGRATQVPLRGGSQHSSDKNEAGQSCAASGDARGEGNSAVPIEPRTSWKDRHAHRRSVTIRCSGAQNIPSEGATRVSKKVHAAIVTRLQETGQTCLQAMRGAGRRGSKCPVSAYHVLTPAGLAVPGLCTDGLYKQFSMNTAIVCTLRQVRLTNLYGVCLS